MMTNLHQKYGEILHEYCIRESDVLLIIAPFISIDAIQSILGDRKNVVVVTSWRKDHLLSGASTIELYPLCKKRNWKLFVNSRIHAKIYSQSYNSCYIGSANCTNNALFSNNGNIESMMFVSHLGLQERLELKEIILKSFLVDDHNYLKVKNWYDNIEVSSNHQEEEISYERPFLLNDLPATNNPDEIFHYINTTESDGHCDHAIEHDIVWYLGGVDYKNYNDFIETIRASFLDNPFIEKIIEQITSSGISFGAMTEFIHNNCSDVPSPYRKDVKIAVQNLFSWLTFLEPNIYEIKIPGRHSQVIYKK